MKYINIILRIYRIIYNLHKIKLFNKKKFIKDVSELLLIPLSTA